MADKKTDNVENSTDIPLPQCRNNETRSVDTGLQDNVPNIEDQNEDDNDGIRIRPVPPDFRFNKLLMTIENSITNDELDKLKAMLRGDGLICERMLCEIQTASELFRVMRQSLLITREDILWLQGILRVLERPELIEKTIEWSRMYGNIMHFREAPEPINGFSHSKFHVEGKDFTNLTRRKLQRLRSQVADLLCVPERFVIIAGVEPSSSFVVTLMMPNMYVDILKRILKKTNEIEELNEIGVDTIAIGEEMFSVNGVIGGELVANDQQMKFLNVYKQLKTKSKLLEDREIECLKLSREVESMIVPNLTMQTIKHIFPNVQAAHDDTAIAKQIPASLASQSSFVEFQEALRQVTQCGYDRNVIGRLLNSNSSVVSSRVRDNYRIQTEHMNLAIQDLESTLVPLQIELAKYKFYLHVDVQELENNMLTMLQNLVKSITHTVTVELTQPWIALLKKVSGWLRFSDRQKLQKKYEWDPEDNLTQALRQDKSLLLPCIVYKEIERTQGELDVVQFIADCLKEVRRDDLIKKFLDAVKKQPKTPTQRDESPLRKRRPSEPQSQQESSQQQQAPNIDMAKFADQVSNIDKKVTEIHETIQSTKKAFNTDYGNTKYNFMPRSMYDPRDTAYHV